MLPIKMLVEISIPKQDYESGELEATLGDFYFRFGDRVLKFGFNEWESMSYNNEDSTIVKFASGRGYFSYPGISVRYISDIMNRGFDPHSISAKFLSEVDEIMLFNSTIQIIIINDEYIPMITGVIDVEDSPHILNIEFIDGDDKHYKVDSYVISNYNLKIDELDKKEE